MKDYGTCLSLQLKAAMELDCEYGIPDRCIAVFARPVQMQHDIRPCQTRAYLPAMRYSLVRHGLDTVYRRV